MQRTGSIASIDQCLIRYIEDNNAKFKTDVTTVYMDKAKLAKFYNNMIESYQTELTEEESNKMASTLKGSKKKKIKSVFCGENEPTNWKNREKTQMVRKPLISNVGQGKGYQLHNVERNQNRLGFSRQAGKQNFVENEIFRRIDQKNYIRQSRIKRQKTHTEELNHFQEDEFRKQRISNNFEILFHDILREKEVEARIFARKDKSEEDEEYDKSQIRQFKQAEQEKYVKKYCLKQKHKAVPIKGKEVQGEQEKIKKKDRKISVLFGQIVNTMSEKDKQIGKKKIDIIKEENEKKERMQKLIKNYFIKKNRYCPIL